MSSNKRPGPETERRIIYKNRAVAHGDAAASASLAIDLDRLFETNRAQVYRLCLRMIGDPQRAEDLTQETLAVAWRRLPEFDPKARFSTWIYAIARNLCLNAQRKKRDLLSFDGVIEPSDPVMGVYSKLREQERQSLLREAAAAVLDSQEQEAVHLRYVENMSQNDITEVLGLDGTGARGLLQRCRRKLSRELRRRLVELGHGESLFHKTL